MIPESFRPIYDVLFRIRNELEKLSITKAWSLREADLYDFQRQLDKIDESRVNGNWLDEDGKPAELYVQRVSNYSDSCRILADTVGRRSFTSSGEATPISTRS